MVGDYNGSALFLITPDETGFDDPSVESTSTELTPFDLSDPLTVSREMMVGTMGYPSDEEAYITRVELLFAWVDLTFTLDSGPMAGDHVVRVAYADVVDLGYHKGDVLYKDTDGAFKWLDTAAVPSSLSTTRPESTVQISDLAAYEGTQDGKGNQHIPCFSADIAPEQQLALPRRELTSGGPWSFTVYFDLGGGIGFDRAIGDIRNVSDLMTAFDIAADVGGSGDVGFAARVEVVEVQ